MRRAQEFSTPSGVPIMPDRYYSLELAVSGEARTHRPLIAFDQGRLLPAGCGDPPGIFYVIPKLVTVFDVSLSRGFVAFLVLWVSACGLFGIAGFFTLFGNTTTSYIAALVEVFLAWRAFRAGDLYFVAPCVVIALVPWALLLWERCTSARWLSLFALFAGMLLGFANFLRDEAGSGMLLFLVVLAGLNRRLQRRARLLGIAATLVGVALPAFFAHHLLDQRDVYLSRLQPDYVPAVRHHLFWHTAYIGFGFLRNDFVPAYKDEVAADQVRTVDPSVTYLSSKYDSYLRLAVLKLVRRHPSFVMATVFAKLGMLVLYLLISANIGLVAALLMRKPWPVELAFCTAMVVSALPGIIAVPTVPYLLGFCSFGAIFAVVSIGYFVRGTRKEQAALHHLGATAESAGYGDRLSSDARVLESSSGRSLNHRIRSANWLVYACGVFLVVVLSVGLSHSQVRPPDSSRAIAVAPPSAHAAAEGQQEKRGN